MRRQLKSDSQPPEQGTNVTDLPEYRLGKGGERVFSPTPFVQATNVCRFLFRRATASAPLAAVREVKWM